ncbi:MAG: hypothetical protein ACODAA_09140, partial [Gemmatimonadota bacterium]
MSRSSGSRRLLLHLSATLTGLLLLTAALSSDGRSWSDVPSCGGPEVREGGRPGSVAETSRDLFCVELTPVPSFPAAAATIELRHGDGPFTVSPGADGRLRYEGIVRTDGLPSPDSLGNYGGYGVWI